VVFVLDRPAHSRDRGFEAEPAHGFFQGDVVRAEAVEKRNDPDPVGRELHGKKQLNQKKKKKNKKEQKRKKKEKRQFK
jgi:hypothetical protein